MPTVIPAAPTSVPPAAPRTPAMKAPSATPPPPTPSSAPAGDAPPPAASLKSMLKDTWNAAPKAPDAPKPAGDAPPAPDAAKAPDAPAPDAAPEPSIFDKIKKPDAKPAADAPPAPDAPDETPPDGLSEKGKVDWKKMKLEMAQARKEAAEAKAIADKYKTATPAENERTKELEAKLKDREDRLAMLDYKSSDDFAQRFELPKSAALSEAQEILNYNEKGGVDLTVLLSKSTKDFNAEVSKITEGMNAMDATAVQTSLRNAHKLTAESQNALAKAGEITQKIREQAAMRQKADFDATFTEIGVTDGLFGQQEIPETASPEEKQSIQAMNEALAGVRSKAEALAFGKIDSKTAARVAAKAAMFDVHLQQVIPRMHQHHEKVVGQLNAALAELKALRGAKGPSAGGDASTNAAPEDNSKMDLKQLWKKTVG